MPKCQVCRVDVVEGADGKVLPHGEPECPGTGKWDWESQGIFDYYERCRIDGRDSGD